MRQAASAGSAVFPPLWRGEVYAHDRIRVAYLSADFHDHPVAYLTAGLFEHHDRSRFEITALSFGPDQASPMRDRIKGAVEHFIDVRSAKRPGYCRAYSPSRDRHRDRSDGADKA